MPQRRQDLLLQALRDPASVSRLNAAEWDVLVRLARRADLLGRVADLLLRDGEPACIPPAALAHLRAEQVVLAAQRASVQREVIFLERALLELGQPVVLLKGAAYLIGELPASAGRTFSDIDLLVPREALAQVESALMAGGWQSTHLNAYDQRYYREWMHELPPLQHLRRHSVLDVHHNIMPLTARLKPDAALLLAAAMPLPGRPMWQMLCPADMVLHSMTHLFHNEEFSHGLRDLSDLDCLLRHFGRQPEFWDALISRAALLNLLRPLFYGLRYTQSILATPIPAALMARVAASAAPAFWLQPLMDALWLRVLCAPHPLAVDRWAPVAGFCLYVRSHWLKMPVWRLLPHLLHKALFSKPPEAKTQA